MLLLHDYNISPIDIISNFNFLKVKKKYKIYNIN